MSTPPPDPPRHRVGGLTAVALFLAAALVILLFGVTTSRASGDWTWLARSGSLLVVLGIVFAYFNIDGFFERSLHRALVHNAHFQPGESHGLLTNLRVHLAHDVSEIPNTIKAIEVAVIVLGTLLWGFGDLLGE